MRSSRNIAIIYLVAAGSWILGSDLLVGLVVAEPESTISFNILKGLGFVLVTGSLLYLVLRREFARRERAETDLRMVERAVVNLEEGILVTDNEIESPGPRIQYVNPALERITGYSADELIGQNPRILQGERTDRNALDRVRAALESGSPVSERTINYRKDGTPFVNDWDISPTPNQQGELQNWVAVIRDVTVQVQAEEDLRAAEERYRHIVEEVPAVIYTIRARDVGETVEFVSPQIEKLLGYTPEEWKENPDLWRSSLHPDDRDRVGGELSSHLRDLTPYRSEYRIFTRSGETIWVQDEANHVPSEDSDDPFWRGVVTNITKIKSVELELSRNLNRLAALRTIDNAITSNLEIRHILNVVIDQVIAQLNVVGAVIFLVDEPTGSLSYRAGSGVADSLASRASIPLTSDPAGRAALERRVITIDDVSSVPEVAARIGDVTPESYAYVAVPLVLKDQTSGALEVFVRYPYIPEESWLSFLQAIAVQASIAIDNASLLERLQRTNESLERSYDNTLAGLAAALELRDDETGGHSERVTNLAVALARECGVEGDDLTHIRHGALLHDVGKIGIPDDILRKPGPLSEEEWEVMRRHPELGNDLLTRIRLPGAVIDIPYYHHERWDGTGYPHGLRECDIPLAARIFAVADVWDALTRDRPYRTAWTEEAALAHLKKQAGSHFDPEIVDIFMSRVLARESSSIGA